ncbi:hypothetical protein ACPV5W_18170 [Vibrio astriarenae]
MAKKKNILIHIGMNKNGTTTLQKFLALNSEVLEKVGYSYPLNLTFSEAHYPISAAFGFGPNSIERSTTEDIISQLIAIKQDNIIISSEYFCLNYDPSNLIGMLSEHFNITVVCYFRRHDLWLNSLYNQAVKNTRNPPWDKGFYEFYKFYKSSRSTQCKSYKDLIQRWECFDVNFVAKSLSRSQLHKGDLISDFINILGVGDTIEFDRGIPNINESISVQNLDVLDTINRAPYFSEVDKIKLKNAIVSIDEGGSTNVIDESLASEILTDCQGDITFFSDRFDEAFFDTSISNCQNEKVVIPPVSVKRCLILFLKYIKANRK